VGAVGLNELIARMTFCGGRDAERGLDIEGKGMGVDI